MQKIFDTLIDSFIENKIGIATNFLEESLAMHLKKNLLNLHTLRRLKAAGTGRQAGLQHDSKFRSDRIYWLDPAHRDIYEDLFFKHMDAFITYLNASCYTGITGCEFHYTLYESGTFYKRHLDRFRTADHRKYSMIMYLNDDWVKEDGGELCIHQDGSIRMIEPRNGSTVFFQSNVLEHEVLPTHKARMSITGWLLA